MTFKHTTFTDSPTMRSLERLAVSKGWIKSEEIKKVAKPVLDLSPSDTLSENIMKLCAGLKQSGLAKYAEEVESKFISYKKARTMYETFKETGEDLIDSAHPEGSHKLEGVQGDAVVETIIDQHLKSLKVVLKMPTGKLSSASDILKAVKVVLAVPTIPALPIGTAPAWYPAAGGAVATPTSTGFLASMGLSGLASAPVWIVGGIIGGVVGGTFGYFLYDRNFDPKNLEDAGTRLLKEINDFSTDDAANTIISNVSKLENIIPTLVPLFDGAKQLSSNPSINNLNSLIKLLKQLQSARVHVLNIFQWAKNQSGGLFSGARDVLLAAQNFMNFAEKYSEKIQLFINEIKTEFDKQNKETATKTPKIESEFSKLQADFITYITNIDKYSSQIRALNRPNGDVWIAALDKLKANVKEKKEKELDLLNPTQQQDENTLKPFQDFISKTKEAVIKAITNMSLKA